MMAVESIPKIGALMPSTKTSMSLSVGGYGTD